MIDKRLILRVLLLFFSNKFWTCEIVSHTRDATGVTEVYHLFQKMFPSRAPTGMKRILFEFCFDKRSDFRCDDPKKIKSFDDCMRYLIYVVFHVMDKKTTVAAFHGNASCCLLWEYFIHLVIRFFELLHASESPINCEETHMIAKLICSLMTFNFPVQLTESPRKSTLFHGLLMQIIQMFPDGICLIAAIGITGVDALPLIDDDALLAARSSHFQIFTCPKFLATTIMFNIGELVSNLKTNFTLPDATQLNKMVCRDIIEKCKTSGKYTPEELKDMTISCCGLLIATGISGGATLQAVKQLFAISSMELPNFPGILLESCLNGAQFLVYQTVHSDEFLLDPSALKRINDSLTSVFSTYQKVREFIIQKLTKESLSPLLFELSRESLVLKMAIKCLFPEESKLVQIDVLIADASRGLICCGSSKMELVKLKRERSDALDKQSRIPKIRLKSQDDVAMYNLLDCHEHLTLRQCLVTLHETLKKKINDRQELWKGATGVAMRKADAVRTAENWGEEFDEEEFLNTVPKYRDIKKRCEDLAHVIAQFENYLGHSEIKYVRDLKEFKRKEIHEMHAKCDVLLSQINASCTQIEERKEHARRLILEALGIPAIPLD